MGKSLVPTDAIFAEDFRVVRLLRSGGMGSVYLVEQQSTGKLRALKLLASRLRVQEEVRLRFEREARAASLIDSDHVVEVVTAGIDEGTNMPYLVMELLSGEDLGDAIARRERLPLIDVVEIFRQIGHALERAHRRGIIHRDLKPENIFLAEARRPDVPFTAKLLDFGVAKFLAPEGAGAQTQPVGSPLFMAPEQTEVSGEVGPGTDVWALGLLAFYLLTGKSYWLDAETAGVPFILRQILFDPMPRASERERDLGDPGNLFDGFDEWFARCTQRAVAERYPDGGACARAFAELATRSPARPKTPVPVRAIPRIVSIDERSSDPGSYEPPMLGSSDLLLPVSRVDAQLAATDPGAHANRQSIPLWQQLMSLPPRDPILEGLSPRDALGIAGTASEPLSGDHPQLEALRRGLLPGLPSAPIPVFVGASPNAVSISPSLLGAALLFAEPSEQQTGSPLDLLQPNTTTDLTEDDVSLRPISSPDVPSHEPPPSSDAMADEATADAAPEERPDDEGNTSLEPPLAGTVDVPPPTARSAEAKPVSRVAATLDALRQRAIGLAHRKQRAIPWILAAALGASLGGTVAVGIRTRLAAGRLPKVTPAAIVTDEPTTPEAARDTAREARRAREEKREPRRKGAPIPSDPTCGEGRVRVAEGSSLCIDAVEVSASAYRACMRAGGCDKARDKVVSERIRPDLQPSLSESCVGMEGGDLAKNCVTLDEARAYCTFVEGRLPRRSEWIAAFTSGGTRAAPWGDAPVTGLVGNGCDLDCASWAIDTRVFVRPEIDGSDGYGAVAPVGMFPRGASATGVLDLAGNVSEWVDDATRDDVACGASFFKGALADASCGDVGAHDVSLHNVGFRCVYERPD